MSKISSIVIRLEMNTSSAVSSAPFQHGDLSNNSKPLTNTNENEGTYASLSREDDRKGIRWFFQPIHSQITNNSIARYHIY